MDEATAKKHGVPAGETVLFAIRPSPVWLLLRLGTWWGIALIVTAISWMITRSSPPVWLAARTLMVLLLITLWLWLVWVRTSYVLTDRRLLVRFGVFTRTTIDIPMARVQNLLVHRSFIELALGVASILVSTAGSQAAGAVLAMVEHPARIEALLRGAMKGEDV